MISMVEKEIVPAAEAYGTRLADFILKVKGASPAT
jgi:hypothetical protein